MKEKYPKDSLTKILLIGEALSTHLVSKFLFIYGTQTKLENLYGPTETTVHVTRCKCRNKNIKVIKKMFLTQHMYQ